jgi:hypothetical protein
MKRIGTEESFAKEGPAKASCPRPRKHPPDAGDRFGVRRANRPIAGWRGKSVIATVAGSVWGCKCDLDLPTFSETWNNTVNNLDRVAAPHHPTFLALDETKNIDHGNSKLFHVFAKALMRLAEGSAKGRMTDVDDPATWWMGFLSTSNLSLDEIAAIDHCQIDDAHRTRLIDVPLPPEASGAFECLHVYDDHAAFATELLRIARNHYGVASAAVIERLSAWRTRDEAGLRKWLSSCRDHCRCEAKRLIASGQRDLARLHEKSPRFLPQGRWRSSSGFCRGRIASLRARC